MSVAQEKVDSPELQGRVMRAAKSSFEGLEDIARITDAKGCFFDRFPHRKEKKIERWLQGIEADDYYFNDFACAMIQVAFEPDSKDIECTLAGPEEIRAACEKLVRGLPSSFRRDVRSDAENLANMCVRLCPDVPWITFRLEIVQRNGCWKWHQDNYVGRAIISYVGPGTHTADDSSVQWDRFENTTNEDCVAAESIQQMQTNAVLLMKGKSWRGIRGKGLVHRSPVVHEGDPPMRLVLKVDLHDSPRG